jgi:hypothetical protein
LLAFDTETVEGRAVILGVAGLPEGHVFALSSLRSRVLDVESFGQAFRVIFDLAEETSPGEKSSDAWTFNLDYDVRALLVWTSRQVLRDVQLRRPRQISGFALDYIPGKTLEVKDVKSGRILRVWDAWQFYESGLDEASSRIGGRGKSPVSKASLLSLGKMTPGSKRWKFISRYCLQDAEETLRVASYLVESIASAGLDVSRYYSAGYLAKSALRSVHDCEGRDTDRLFGSSYYGGRVECLRRGRFPSAYIYDIRSAYPSALARLPDLCRTEVVESRAPIPGAVASVSRVKVWTRDGAVQPFPIRTSDGNVYPKLVGTTLDLQGLELSTAVELGLVERVEYVRSLSLVGTRFEVYRPLVLDLYDRKRRDAPDRLAVKKVLNSLYGVFAERVREYGKDLPEDARFGALNRRLRLEGFESDLGVRDHVFGCPCEKCRLARRVRRLYPAKALRGVALVGGVWTRVKEHPGRFSHPFYAGFITAHCRAALLTAATLRPSAVVALATDGVISTERLPLRLGSALGDWEETRVRDLTVVSNGIYAYEVEGRRVVKFRGVESKLGLLSALSTSKSDSVRVVTRRPVGLVEHLNRGAPLNLMTKRVLRLDLRDSRRTWPEGITGRGLLSRSFDSEPLILDSSRMTRHNQIGTESDKSES